MKTKRSTYPLLIVFSFSLLVFLSGCKKVETTKTYTVTDTTAQTSVANDELIIGDEFSQAVDDAVTIICNRKAHISGSETDVDTSQITLGVITIYYGGEEADGTSPAD